MLENLITYNGEKLGRFEKNGVANLLKGDQEPLNIMKFLWIVRDVTANGQSFIR
jgi:hypothetical protein